MTTLAQPGHGEPDAGKLARPVRGEGWGDLRQQCRKALHPYSTGGLSGGVQLIADYRFTFGLLVAANLGVWIRPEHQFAGVKISDMAQLGAAGEMYIVQRWGLSVIGELYGYPSLTKYPEDSTQIPAEALLGLRLQTRQGITITIGGSFGAACGFGAAALRVFNSVTWQPKFSDEQREINRVLERGSADPDQDGVIEPADKCPTVAGSPQNDGCPDQDGDGDSVSDHEDRCPDRAALADGSNGCPAARVERELITTFEAITFAPGSAELSKRATVILESVVRRMYDTGSIRLIEVQAHTDARESDGRTSNLSQERAESVARWMLNAGVEEERISMRGYGHSHPEVDDSDCIGPAEALPHGCEAATGTNRRVVFRILRWGARPSSAILGDQPANVLPIVSAGEVSKSPPFPSCRPWTKGKEDPIPCVLPMKPAVFTRARVLESAKDAKGRLPTGSTHYLPKGGVLPKGGGPLTSPTE